MDTFVTVKLDFTLRDFPLTSLGHDRYRRVQSDILSPRGAPARGGRVGAPEKNRVGHAHTGNTNYGLKICQTIVCQYKSSVVADMGDRGHNRHGPKTGGGLLCPFRGELGPRLTQGRMGRGLPPYQVAS